VALALKQAGTEPITLFYCGGGGETLMRLGQCPGQWAPDLVFEGLAVMAALR